LDGSTGLGSQPDWRPGDDLTRLEETMVAGAASGELVDCGEGPFSLAEMQAWEADRTLRAAVLRHLLITGEWPVDAKGVRLRGARIGGLLDLEAAAVRCPLALEECYLDADEPARLDHASASRVTLAKCHLAGLSGQMLTARQLDLRGSTLTHRLYLPNADIAGNLACDGAQLTGADSDGNALFADGLKTGGNVFLRDAFTAAGAVRLPGADIAGQFDCTGAQLTGVDSDGDALFADGLKTGGAVFLRGGFTAAGTVSLSSARVGASVYLTPTALAIDGKVALNAAGAQIVGTLRWAPASAVSGQVNLEGATAGRLDDDWSSGRPNGYWPTGGRLRLDGFTYDRFGGAQRATANQRLAWIRSQYQANAADSQAEFATQPYEQLTAVYQQAGQDTEARKVAIARRADLRKYGDLNSYRRVGNWFLGWSIGYGYKTWRAGLVLVGVFAAVVVLSFFAQQHHLMVPVGDTDGLRFVPSATRCTSSYPCFSPVGYAVDTVIPVVNVHQADNWGPDAHTTLGHAWAAGTRFATVLGWALATLLVAGFTGIVRRD